MAITQFGTNQIAEMTRDPAIDAFMTVGPLDSKITSDASPPRRARGEPNFSRSMFPKPSLKGIRAMNPRKFLAVPSVRRRPSGGKIETVSVNHLIVSRHTLV